VRQNIRSRLETPKDEVDTRKVDIYLIDLLPRQEYPIFQRLLLKHQQQTKAPLNLLLGSVSAQQQVVLPDFPLVVVGQPNKPI